MSRQVALDNIWLRPAPRWAHTEYSLEYHRPYLAARTGEDPGSPDLLRKGYDSLCLDLLWSTNDGFIDWSRAGRITDMGHAEYASGGGDRRTPVPCPFRSPEEVWAFDAVREYGLPDFQEQVRAYEALAQEWRAAFPEQLVTGGYYRTIVSGAIQAFGWEMLLLAAANPSRMERVLDTFFQRALFHMRAWAATSVEVVIQHDDFVWSAGPFIRPDFCRRAIIARYAELWRPLHAAGKKVLFCSDGNYAQFAADIVEAGADGLIFEPCNDFAFMAENFGGSVCLVGSFVDCRDLARRRAEKVLADVRRTLQCLRRCRGAIIAVGNHLAPDVPPDMLDLYFGSLLPALGR